MPRRLLTISRHWPLKVDYGRQASRTQDKYFTFSPSSAHSLFTHIGQRYIQRRLRDRVPASPLHLPLAPALWLTEYIQGRGEQAEWSQGSLQDRMEADISRPDGRHLSLDSVDMEPEGSEVGTPGPEAPSTGRRFIWFLQSLGLKRLVEKTSSRMQKKGRRPKEDEPVLFREKTGTQRKIERFILPSWLKPKKKPERIKESDRQTGPPQIPSDFFTSDARGLRKRRPAEIEMEPAERVQPESTPAMDQDGGAVQRTLILQQTEGGFAPPPSKRFPAEILSAQDGHENIPEKKEEEVLSPQREREDGLPTREGQLSFPAEPTRQPLAMEILTRLVPKFWRSRQKKERDDLSPFEKSGQATLPSDGEEFREQKSSEVRGHTLVEDQPDTGISVREESLPERDSSEKEKDLTDIEKESEAPRTPPWEERPLLPLLVKIPIVKKIVARSRPAAAVDQARFLFEPQSETDRYIELPHRSPGPADRPKTLPDQKPVQEPVFRAAQRGFQALSQGPGIPLHVSLREKFEAFFGQDLSRVEIHTGWSADTVTGELGAEAVTMGRHIFFASSVPEPQTPHRLGLLAHELTHVLQQRSMGIEQLSIPKMQGDDRYPEVQPEMAFAEPSLVCRGPQILGMRPETPPVMTARSDRGASPSPAPAPPATARIMGVEAVQEEAEGENLDELVASVYDAIKRRLRVEGERLPQ